MAILQGDQGSVKFDVDGSGETAAAAIAGDLHMSLQVFRPEGVQYQYFESIFGWVGHSGYPS